MNAIVSMRELNVVEQLVIRAQAGDHDAMNALCAQFQNTIAALARKRLPESDVEDLVQDVLLQATRKLNQLRAPAAFPGWIKTMTVRLAINYGKRRKATVSADPDLLAQTMTCGQTPLDDLQVAEQASEVRDGMAALRDMDRQTLEAFYFDGKSLNEMCDQFDAPLGTIKRRLHTARRRLAKHLEPFQVV